MNYKILILAASALLMGACSDREQDVSQEVGAETQTPEYVYGDQGDTSDTQDMIEGDGSETPNDNTVVDTRVDAGPANMDTPESDVMTEPMPEPDGSPETTGEATPQ